MRRDIYLEFQKKLDEINKYNEEEFFSIQKDINDKYTKKEYKNEENFFPIQKDNRDFINKKIKSKLSKEKLVDIYKEMNLSPYKKEYNNPVTQEYFKLKKSLSHKKERDYGFIEPLKNKERDYGSIHRAKKRPKNNLNYDFEYKNPHSEISKISIKIEKNKINFKVIQSEFNIIFDSIKSIKNNNNLLSSKLKFDIDKIISVYDSTLKYNSIFPNLTSDKFDKELFIVQFYEILSFLLKTRISFINLYKLKTITKDFKYIIIS